MGQSCEILFTLRLSFLSNASAKVFILPALSAVTPSILEEISYSSNKSINETANRSPVCDPSNSRRSRTRICKSHLVSIHWAITPRYDFWLAEVQASIIKEILLSIAYRIKTIEVTNMHARQLS